jgi:hypothetical protein
MAEQPNGTAAAGWYRDQADPVLLRWWDGTTWTAHTRPAAPAGVVVDHEIKGGRLVATADSVALGGRTVRLDEVTGLAYWVVAPADDGPAATAGRGFELTTATDTLKVVLAGDDDRRATWETLVSLCQARVEPRLVDSALTGLDRGEAFATRGVTVRPDGFSVGTSRWGGRAWPWEEFGHADLRAGSVRIHLADRSRLVGCVPLRTRNAVLLPDLLHRASRRRP